MSRYSENDLRLAKEISNVKKVSSMEEEQLRKILDLSFFAFKYIYEKELTVSTEFYPIDIEPPNSYLLIDLINDQVENIKNKRDTSNNEGKLPSVEVKEVK